MNEHLQDWQRGSKSTMNSMDRLIHHNIWLKQQQEELKRKIKSKYVVEERPVIGFVKD